METPIFKNIIILYSYMIANIPNTIHILSSIPNIKNYTQLGFQITSSIWSFVSTNHFMYSNLILIIFKQIWLIDGTLTGTSTLGVMAMKEYSALSKAPGLEPYYQMQYDTPPQKNLLEGSLTPLPGMQSTHSQSYRLGSYNYYQLNETALYSIKNLKLNRSNILFRQVWLKTT